MQGAGKRQRYSTNSETPTSARDSGCVEPIPRTAIGPILLILTKVLGPNSTFGYIIERGYEERHPGGGVLSRHDWNEPNVRLLDSVFFRRRNLGTSQCVEDTSLEFTRHYCYLLLPSVVCQWLSVLKCFWGVTVK